MDQGALCYVGHWDMGVEVARYHPKPWEHPCWSIPPQRPCREGILPGLEGGWQMCGVPVVN